MKKLSPLFAFALGLQAASAAPYVVYSGEAQATVTSASGPVTRTTEVYLVTDLADTSSYGILQFDAKTKQGAITIYPIASPTAVESNLNFFGDVATAGGKNSLAVLSLGDILTDSSSNANITHVYATGTLTTARTQLANARPKLTFVTRATGTVTGTVTFPASAAITNDSLPYPPALNGLTLAYTIAPTGSLTQATGDGNFGISLDYDLTPAANIGDEISGGKQTLTALYPVSTANSTVLVAYDNFLRNLATALGVTLPVTNLGGIGGDGGGITITTGGGGTGVLGTGGTGTLTVTGGSTYSGGTTISGGTILTGGGSGTLTLTGGGTYSGGTTISGGTISTGGATITGTGVLTGNTYSGTTQINSGTLNLGGNTGGTLTLGSGQNASGNNPLTFNLNGSTSNTGTIILGSGGLILNTGSVTPTGGYTLLSGSVGITSGAITITTQ